VSSVCASGVDRAGRRLKKARFEQKVGRTGPVRP